VPSSWATVLSGERENSGIRRQAASLSRNSAARDWPAGLRPLPTAIMNSIRVQNSGLTSESRPTASRIGRLRVNFGEESQ